jgi:hypothetical protein
MASIVVQPKNEQRSLLADASLPGCAYRHRIVIPHASPRAHTRIHHGSGPAQHESRLDGTARPADSFTGYRGRPGSSLLTNCSPLTPCSRVSSWASGSRMTTDNRSQLTQRSGDTYHGAPSTVPARRSYRRRAYPPSARYPDTTAALTRAKATRRSPIPQTIFARKASRRNPSNRHPRRNKTALHGAVLLVHTPDHFWRDLSTLRARLPTRGR